MRAGVSRRLVGGLLVAAAVLGGSLIDFGDTRTPAGPFRPATEQSLLSSLGSSAQAAPSPCPAGVYMQWSLPATFFETRANYHCTGYPVRLSQTVTMKCDGGLDIQDIPYGSEPIGECAKGPCTTPMSTLVDWTANYNTGTNCGGFGCECREESAATPLLICETTDPLCVPPPPSCSTDQSLEPISMVTGENTFSLDVLPLPTAGGFPATFSAQWRGGRSAVRLSNLMDPLGARVSHSFSYFLHKLGNTARVSRNGGVEVFNWDSFGQVWVAAESRLSTLAAGGPTTCLPQNAILTLQDGSKVRFNDYCGGANLAEGMPIRHERADGNYVVFEVVSGRIEAVTDRLGARVEFEYLGEKLISPEPELSWGNLVAVDGPANGPTDKFVFQQDRSVLSAIVQTGGNAIWTLDVASLTGGVETLTDAKSNIARSWTYAMNDGLTVLSEKGKGMAAPAVSISKAGSTVSLAFDPPGPTASATNTYTVAGSPSHVVNRTVAGFCPNCGSSNMEKRYWPNTNLVHAVKDGDGFVKVFEQYENGNAKRIFEGCEDTDSDPLNVTPLCTGLTPPARQIDLTFLPGGNTVECRTEPSVIAGQTVTGRVYFMGDPVDEAGCGLAAGDTRPRFVKRTGRTAVLLNGTADTSKIRTTKFTYGGGAPGYGGGAGLDVTQIDGPFFDDGSGTPPATAPQTTYAYWAAGATDCNPDWPFPIAANTNRVRYVNRQTGSSILTTELCSYDNAGRPSYVVQPNGVAVSVQYDWRGQTTQIKLNAAPLETSLTTNLEYDANGLLVAVKFPRTNGAGARVGIAYAYNDQQEITDVRRGAFSGSLIPSPLHRITYTYDEWGKPLETNWIDSAGVIRTSQKTEYDAFHRLACVASPAGSCLASAQRGTFEYDPEGLLKAVKDAQNDDFLQGSLSDLGKRNRFGKVEKTQQTVCNHPAGQENSPCPLPTATPAITTYEYDAALQLKTVTIADAVRNGTMVNEFSSDDFGNVLKVTTPENGTTLFLYDGAGRLSESQDPRQAAASFKIRYNYDRLSRLTLTEKVAGSATALVRFCYDGFDAACGFTNNLAALRRDRLSAVDDGAGKIQYTYDKYGRIIQESRTWNSGAVYTTYYAHDANGNLTQTTLPHGVAIQRAYDDADQVSAVTYTAPGFSQQPIVGSIKWFPSGGIESWNYQTSGSPKWKFVRDSADRVIESKMTNSSESTVYFSDTYGYANDGNVLKIPATANPPNILHDSLGRLQQDRFGTSSTQTYAYDHAGNRTSRVAGGIIYNSSWISAAPPSTLTSKLDQVTWQTNGLLDYGYSDVSGNVTYRGFRPNGESLTTTTTLAYSDEGLVSAVATASGTTNYVRDYRGLRVEKSGAGGAGWFTFGTDGELSGWQGPATNSTCSRTGIKTVVPHEAFVWLDGRPVAIIKSRTQTGTCAGNGFYVDGIFYYFSDKMGLPRVVSKISGLPVPGIPATVWGPATWDAFGNPLTTINEDPDGDTQKFTVPFRLPGQFALGTLEGGPTTSSGGLHDNWFRIYDSTTGRYLQHEPNPMLPTLGYVYAVNSPFAWADRNGRNPALWYALRNGAMTVAAGTSAGAAVVVGTVSLPVIGLGGVVLLGVAGATLDGPEPLGLTDPHPAPLPIPIPIGTPSVPGGGLCTCECTRPATPDRCEEGPRTGLGTSRSIQPDWAACIDWCTEIEANGANDGGGFVSAPPPALGQSSHGKQTFRPAPVNCIASFVPLIIQ